MPRLSVVVPFYGVENYIEDCLRSLQLQQFDDIEVVMVDDGSPDGSRLVAERFADEDPRFKLITQANAGLGPARNTGVKHADAEYITFVDSDDLVTRSSFRRLVESLDATGSSFAGGNAMRFNNTRGVKPSWAHRKPFVRNRFCTHVYDFPDLARDRMVWNKVYRRDFWDEFGYEFPPIRYEDYPVTLKAHLDAVTVDVLAQPVYYWRERESGDSITQQVFKYDNLLDRVASAEMVLDMLPGHPEKVQESTRLMLAESDYIALVQAFATAPDEQIDSILQLSRSFMERLGVSALEARSQFDKIQFEALQKGDVPLLRELATFRGEGGLRGGMRARHEGGSSYVYSYPGLGTPGLSRELYAAKASDVGLRTAVDSVLVEPSGRVTVSGVAEVRHIATEPGTSDLAVYVVNKARRTRLSVERFDAVDSHGEFRRVGFTFSVPADLVETFSEDDKSAGPARFDLAVKAGSTRRNGLLRGLRPGSATWPRSARMANGKQMRVAHVSGTLSLDFSEDVWSLTGASVDGDELLVEAIAHKPLQMAQLMLGGNALAKPLRYPTTTRIEDGRTIVSGRLPLQDVLERTTDEDPYRASNVRDLFLETSRRRYPLMWETDRSTAGAGVEGHVFRLTRSHSDRASLMETINLVTTDSVAVENGALVVRGRNWTGATDVTFGWRRYLPGTDDHVDTTGDLRTDGNDWTFSTPVGELFDFPLRQPRFDPLANLEDWTLFVTSPSLRLDTSVTCEPFCSENLPIEVAAPAEYTPLRGWLRTHAGTLHLEIRSTSRPGTTPSTIEGR